MASDFRGTKLDGSVSSSRSGSSTARGNQARVSSIHYCQIYLLPSMALQPLVCSHSRQAREGSCNPQQKGKLKHPEMPGSDIQESTEVLPCTAGNCSVRLIPNGISAQHR